MKPSVPNKKQKSASKTRKSKSQQLLISRFFAAVPKTPPKPPAQPLNTSTAPTEHVPSEAVKPANNDAHQSSTKHISPISPDSSILAVTPNIQHHKRISVPSEAISSPPPVSPKSHSQDIHNLHIKEADTPATIVLDSPSAKICADSPCSTPERPKICRKRLSSLLEDSEIEDDPISRKRQKSKDLDFQISACDEQSDSSQDDHSLLEIDGNCENESKRPSTDTNPPQPTRPHQFDALSSFELNRQEASKQVPRDAVRRKKFTRKIGRLEKNSFFLRRTGGGGDVQETKSGPQKSTKYTPLETQVVKLRKRHPDMLLVIECGYKYRLFDCDATIASKVLRVASFFDHNFLTAGFPTHRLSYHVRRLVDAGYKVGVVSQSETAALKRASAKSSGLFERKLSAVYTKGTIVADGKLGGSPLVGTSSYRKAAFYIMSIFEIHADLLPNNTKKLAIAAVDCASGNVFFDSFEDDALGSELESRLVSIEPVEILMARTLSTRATEVIVKGFCDATNARLERVADKTFGPREVAEKVKLRIEEACSVVKGSESHVIFCIGALVQYLKQFNLELSITNAVEYKEFQTSRQMKIGADVLRNFEVFGNSNNGSIGGSLVGLVNRTKTAFGSRQMRQWISHPLANGKEIVDRLESVNYLRSIVDDHIESTDAPIPVDVAMNTLLKTLPKLPDLDQGLTRIACHKCTPSELIAVLSAIENVGDKVDYINSTKKTASLPSMLAKLFYSAPNVGNIANGAIVRVLKPDVASQDVYHDLYETWSLCNAGSEGSESVSLPRPPIRSQLQSRYLSQFISDSESLKQANAMVKEAEAKMKMILESLRESHSKPKWDWKKVGQEEYLLEVPTSQASKMAKSWTIVCQTKSVKRFRPPEADEGYQNVLCARETRDVNSSKCWQSYLTLFAEIAGPLRAIVRILSDLDCLSALARVANLPGYSKPEIETDENQPAGLIVKNARHPLTELLSSCTSYVPNDITLGSGSHEIALIVSGPNYGGKSSYARMTALIVIMSQLGSFVPASSAKLCPYDSIYARMGSSDSISKGMSSLMVELAETSRILRDASARSLVVLDELGRGTSTHDGTAIAFSTLSHLVGSIGCTTIFVTHYPTVASLRSVYPRLIRASYMNYLEAKGIKGAETPSHTDVVNSLQRQEKQQSKIVFLYKLTDGVASSSYGLNVASLAGIEEKVIEEASSRASYLETLLERNKEDSEMAYLMGNDIWNGKDVAASVSGALNRLLSRKTK